MIKRVIVLICACIYRLKVDSAFDHYALKSPSFELIKKNESTDSAFDYYALKFVITRPFPST